jgi:hypothetical protein
MKELGNALNFQKLRQYFSHSLVVTLPYLNLERLDGNLVQTPDIAGCPIPKNLTVRFLDLKPAPIVCPAPVLTFSQVKQNVGDF